MTLIGTKPGDEVVIESAQVGKAAQRRLWDLGLIPGTRITAMSCHPFRGPILVRVGESTVAVGRGLAEKIYIRKYTDNEAWDY
ncbi:MAG: FeoA family protein [Bacillota bacterium]|jgi:ferrous iron transport protein A